jgi:hypothetical protein
VATPIQLPDCAKRVLETLFPTVDWTRVTFFSGLPWYIVDTNAITLPDPYSLSRFRIYLGERIDFCDRKNAAGRLAPNFALNTLVHEALHVRQFTQIARGYGPGFARPCYLRYFHSYLGKLLPCLAGRYDKTRYKKRFDAAYATNPFEAAAFAQDGAFAAAHKTAICDCSAGAARLNAAALDEIANYRDPATGAGLVVRTLDPPWSWSWASVLTWPLLLVLSPVAAIALFLMHLPDR